MDNTLLQKAIETLSIQGVFLRSAETRCKESFLAPFVGNKLVLTPQHRGTTTGFHSISTPAVGADGSTTNLIFHFSAGTRLVDSNVAATVSPADFDAESIYIEIIAEFCAHYSLHQNADKTELQASFEEFGKHNVSYHIWPYLREYVQSICCRMGIPPIPVPFFLLPGPAGNGESAPK
jgi:hypothetical protein